MEASSAVIAPRWAARRAIGAVLAVCSCARQEPAREPATLKLRQSADSLAITMQEDSVPTLVGAGDIADCGSDGAMQTAAMLDSIRGTIFIAGDVAYVSKENPHPFVTCFDPAWGRHRARIRPFAIDCAR